MFSIFCLTHSPSKKASVLPTLNFNMVVFYWLSVAILYRVSRCGWIFKFPTRTHLISPMRAQHPSECLNVLEFYPAPSTAQLLVPPHEKHCYFHYYHNNILPAFKRQGEAVCFLDYSILKSYKFAAKIYMLAW